MTDIQFSELTDLLFSLGLVCTFALGAIYGGQR